MLQGKTIISVRKGGIGVSLSGKAPIFDARNQVIGIVLVRYLTYYIANINVSLLWQASLYGTGAFIAAVYFFVDV